jgi:hypothetical protein
VRGTHLGVREDSGDVETSRAFYVHEEGVGALHQALELMFAEFVGSGGMKQIGRHDQVVARASESKEAVVRRGVWWESLSIKMEGLRSIYQAWKALHRGTRVPRDKAEPQTLSPYSLPTAW